MKNKYLTLYLTNGHEMVIRFRHIKHVVFHRDCGMKVVGEITTKTRTIDGTLITNQKQVVEQLEKYFRSKK